MNRRRSFLVALGLVVALVAVAGAAETKKSWRDYIPFTGKSTATSQKPSTTKKASETKKATAAKTSQAVKAAKNKKSASPSTWDKFTSGTKSLVGKVIPASSKKKAETPKKTDKPRTVSEFIKQPRP